jgi:hypothetical protein
VYKGKDLRIKCNGAANCITSVAKTSQISCETASKEQCNHTSDTGETRRLNDVYFEGICPSQTKNAALALQILMAAAKYEQAQGRR